MWYEGNNAIAGLCVNFTPEEYDFDKTDANGFIANVQERNLLPFDKIQVYYWDDNWDFSKYRATNISISYFRFDFTNVPSCFKKDLKNFILISIIENRKKITRIYADYRNISSFMLFCVEHGIIEVENFEPSYIKDWLNNYSEDISERYRSSLIGSIISFCECYESNFGQTFSNEFYNILAEMVDVNLLKAEFENSKTSDIPSDYFDKMLAAAITTIDDVCAPVYYRALSCMILMESQVGLRTGELFALKVGCVKPITISTGDTAYYVEYDTWKRHHGTSRSSKEISYVNEYFKKGYDTIISLSEKTRCDLNTEYLFVESFSGKATSFPVDPGRVSVHLDKLFEYYNRYFQTVYVTPQNNTRLCCRMISKNNEKKYLLRPVITQFRVHVCSDLHAKGCPIEYIEKFMSHLSSEMSYYYVRPKNSVQENMEASIRILRELVTKESIPIGPDKGLMSKIDEFIEENHFSIEKDLESICEKLSEQIPIRIKSGGVCIKSSQFRECSKDAQTDEFYCAYNVCPNIYTFYYMADISYLQIKDLCEAIEINRNRGCTKQVQKNVNMIHSIVNNKLEPQIAELEKIIDEKGLNYVLERHPQMIDIVANLGDVHKEIEKWKSMIV